MSVVMTGMEEKVKNIFQALYDSEINFSVEGFWDKGFSVVLGDSINGHLDGDAFKTMAEVEQFLTESACRHYPNSEFAKRCVVEEEGKYET